MPVLLRHWLDATTRIAKKPLLTSPRRPRHPGIVAGETNTTTAIGAEIRRVRESLGLTLMQFGEAVGVPWQTVQAYESGRAVPPADRLLKIAHETRRAERPFRFPQVARLVAAAA
jgi:DNA-binding XRE family transcriptional regulator